MAKKRTEEAPVRATRERLPRAAKDRAARVSTRTPTPTPEFESESDFEAVTSPFHAASPKVTSKPSSKLKKRVTKTAPVHVATPTLISAPKPKSRVAVKTSSPVSKSESGVPPKSEALPFRFMDLPVEIRNMIYRLLLDYSSIQTVTAKLASLRDNPFDEFDNEWSHRTYALQRWDARRRVKVPRFEHATPDVLFVNKEWYAEAVRELRMAPLIVDENMSQVFSRFSLTMAHLMPLASLKNVEHMHFTMHDPTDDVLTVLWKGGKFTKDMNNGKVRQKAYWLGLLRGSGEKEGDCPVRRLSFETLCDKPMMVDLTDEDALEELTGLLAAEVDREALQMFVETYGSSCASYGG